MSKPYSMRLIHLSCCTAVLATISLLMPSLLMSAIALPKSSVAQLPTEHQFEPPPGSGEPSETVGGGTRLLDRVLNIDFEPPPGQGAPTETLGGASRGPKCAPNEVPVTVLVPETAEGIKYGLTASASPAFLVYIPETVATEIEFIVTDNQPYPNGRIIDERVLKIPAEPGIMRIDLEGDLEFDQYYEWAVYLRCPSQNSSSDATFTLPSSGWIKRIPIQETIEKNIAESSDLEKVIIYAQEGIWFDSLNLLSEQLQKAPDNPNVKQTWSRFLNSELTNLDTQVTQSPLIDCCAP